MNQDNLAAFKDYLIAKKVVNKKYVDYYARWVSSCYGFLNLPLSEVLAPEQKQQLLHHFAKSHEAWQVKQSEAALRLYDIAYSTALE